MRLCGFERDNVTEYSDPDPEGFCYSASFELYPFHEGNTYSLYKGLLNGAGPLQGQFCVVRTLLNKLAEEDDLKPVLKHTQEAQRLAVEFNRQIGYNAVSFQTPLLAQIETKSDFTGLFRFFRPHNKHLKRDEYVILEEFAEDFQNFDSCNRQSSVQTDEVIKAADFTGHNQGKISFLTDFPEAQKEASTNSSWSGFPVTPSKTTNVFPSSISVAPIYNIAQAFSHFTWHSSRNHVVCGLQGTCDGTDMRPTCTLTIPTIHSVSSQFGDSDQSFRGISSFFSQHQCNSICREWATPQRPGARRIRG